MLDFQCATSLMIGFEKSLVLAKWNGLTYGDKVHFRQSTTDEWQHGIIRGFLHQGTAKDAKPGFHLAIALDDGIHNDAEIVEVLATKDHVQHRNG
jgi:hypothetical protein